MKAPFFIGIAILLAVPYAGFAYVENASDAFFWSVQSVDTVKYSRDLARQMLYDASFLQIIDQQVREIAGIGATHVAIGTPYDKEFIPVLRMWVNAARQHGLSVWFRGNWSGWEGWFEYPAISREEHIQKTKKFILDNKSLFQDGDIFTACPECENGGPGDPRNTGDAQGHRKFLMDEYKTTQDSFERIGKRVTSNYLSMNGDIARLIMDEPTTEVLGGIVAIDHYVSSPARLVADVKAIARQSGGRVVLSEFGVPVPDVHGVMQEWEQAQWIQNAFKELIAMPEVVGVNYWTGYGGSTALWREDGAPKASVEVMREYFIPETISGYVKDTLDRPVEGALVAHPYGSVVSKKNGFFAFPYRGRSIAITVTREGYDSRTISLEVPSKEIFITLSQHEKDFWFRFLSFLKNILSFFRRD